MPRKPAEAKAPRTLRSWALAGALLAVLGAGGLLLFPKARVPFLSGAGIAPARDNVLLITLDTTRADHIGAYGHAQARTPMLDRLAREGVRFANVSAVAPLTLPAHASVLTGLLPFEHGVRNNGNFRLDPRWPTLASSLRDHGYRTAAFVSAFVVEHRFGLDHGFDVYDDDVGGGTPAESLNFEAQRRGDQTAMALVRWLEEAPPSKPLPFFAWLHLYDPHEPYAAPDLFARQFPDAPYDAEIAFADSVVAFVVDRLQKTGLLDRTLIAVVGDHGEGLGEHGEEAHAIFVYESTLQVPWILWRPGRLPGGRVVGSLTSLADVGPTLLELVGAPPFPDAHHSRSEVAAIVGAGGAEARAVYAETLNPQFDLGWAPLRAIRDERYKLIDAPRPELYDLARDPHEQVDLREREPALVARMRAALDTMTGGGSWGEMTPSRVDAETREKLAALGYLSGQGAPEATAVAGEGKDPKDGIHVLTLVRRAQKEIGASRFEAGLATVRELDREDPDNLQARLLAGAALMGVQRWADALGELRLFLARKPGRAWVHHSAALCLLRLDRFLEALREADAALASDPRLVEARVLRGRVRLAQGRPEDALGEFRQAAQQDATKPILRLAVAQALHDARRTPEAEAEYRGILAQWPDHPSALARLGILLARPETADECVRLLTRAIALDPGQDLARFVLAQMLGAQGRNADSAQQYDALIASLHAALTRDAESYEARMRLASVLERLERQEEAKAEYRRVARAKAAPAALRAAARARLGALGG